MSVSSWFLVSGGGMRHRLPWEMIFVGRDDCELMLQSRSVDKQHAVINYEPTTDEHKVKDLGSLNGTFVNDVRIQEQVYITLKIDDKLRFGYDTNLFTVVRGELHVPEEALKHEKFNSQLLLQTVKPPEAVPEPSRPAVEVKAAAQGGSEGGSDGAVAVGSKPPETSREEVGGDKLTGDIAVLKRGTPLYGQPSWWGDGDADDENSGKQDGTTTDRKQERSESDGKDPKETTAEAQENGLYTSGQEPSYFEIPSYTNEPPSQDTDGATATNPASGPEVIPQGHASFTIKFDLQASNKVTVKDRVAKVAPEVRPRPPKKGAGEELSALQTAMVAAEVKVADWLAQNEIPLARTESVDRVAEDDGESVKSDVPVQLKSLKGSKHEDGTQSDSENAAALGEQRWAALEDHSRGLWGGRLEGSGVKIREGRANVPEGLFAEEDSPARRHRSSASKMAPIGGELRERERTKDSVPYHRDQHQPIGLGEGFQNRHGDDYSDRGTYTIEIENEDNQEEEARRMIDKVFGVEDYQSLSRVGGYPDIQRERLTTQRPGSGDRGKPGRIEPESLPEELVVGGPRWVSQWATLAASHIRTDPEGSGAESHVHYHTEDRAEISESSHSASMASSSYTERKRRTLPQLPSTKEATPGGRRSPGPAHRPSDVGEKQDTELQEKENQEMGRVGRTKPGGGGGGGSQAGSVGGSTRGSPKKGSPAKNQDAGSRKETVLAKLPPRPVSSGGKRLEEARRRKKEMEEKAKERESVGKPLLRQESFTVERPSTNVPQELIPRIDTQTGARILTKEGRVDSTTRQKDSEAVGAFLETTVSDLGEPISQSIEGSLSPESDVDTTSTVSQAAGIGGRKVVHQKRRTLAAQQKEREKTVLSSSTKGPTRARDTQDRKPKSRPSGGQGTRQAGRAWTSLDLTDDDVNSNSLLSDSQPSIHEVSSHSSHARTQAGSTRVEASTKASRAKNTQASSTTTNTLSKPTTTLPKVRPTRASILRRARLGDSSDTEPADMDRMSVASEASTASSRSAAPGPGIRRGLSRIEALAQPRKPRMGSPSAQSDSEATGGRSRGIGARSIATNYAVRQGLRGVSNMGGIIPRARANSASKLPDKSKGYITPTAGGRWRRMPMDYASTSEDEFGSNRHPSKHSGPARQFASPRLTQLGGSAPATPSPGGIAALRQQSAGREQEEYMKDWTTHSEEIARISQDLAKDLAMLAREIHDVAGEIDSVSPAASAATDPGAMLEERVFDDGLDLGSGPSTENILGNNIRPVELRPRNSNRQGPRAIRRQTWNREDAVLDSLLLASVTQLSARIRHSVDKTAGKIRILFKDKDRKWDEIENKLQAEHDSLLLQTSSTEITTVLQDLKRVERQLLVIDVMVDPDGTLDALTSLGLTSPLTDLQRVSPGAAGPSAAGHPPGGSSGEGPSSSTLSAPSGGPSSGASGTSTQVAERDLGLHVNNNLPSSGGEQNCVVHK
ncbi:centrosomal protein of 170 kDa [Salmo salar]|uniref:Centrosomal protein of 170 kDa n=1 Tax=Salmo salar TaxID=8030 RepID=A0A1S3Q199_SALSA|nr:centrosomal protein of 170 kDa [Salmo salar]|eukprot:XP_014033743.1 PREDICTED: centrosomal protein of 170 kDa-like isoform X2 [Salmo salar]